MTFSPLAALAVAKVCKKKPGLKSVCELGNQRFTATDEVLWKIGIKSRPADTQDFYKRMGFEEYYALDVNEDMGAIIADLNKPIENAFVHPGDWHFDLITNNGTGEHIFNQASVFENVHTLCRIGGVMLHILPMQPWLNHGFYNYNPILFRDLALANDYRWLFLWIADRWGAHITFEDLSGVFMEKRPKILSDAARKVHEMNGADVSIVAALEKTRDGPFRYPFQGKYLGDIADEGLKSAYSVAS